MDEDMQDSIFELKDIIDARRAYIHDSDSDEELTEEKKWDIQDWLAVQGHVSTCATFAGQWIEEAYEGEKVAVDLRVARVLEKDTFDERVVLGTVVEILGKGKVKVKWDTCVDSSSDNKVESLNMKELLLYDNAQIGVIHHFVGCDGCHKWPLRGIRWKCLSCSNYDLCTACYMADKHYLNHSFVRIQSKKSKGFEVSPRDSTECCECSGILKYARVSLREKNEDLDTGTVIELTDKKVNAFMCDAVVEMDGTQASRRFCVGREGKSELCYIEKGIGIPYYEDHLPIMRSGSSKPGMRVVRGPAWNKSNEDGGNGGVGTVIIVSKICCKGFVIDHKRIPYNKIKMGLDP